MVDSYQESSRIPVMYSSVIDVNEEKDLVEINIYSTSIADDTKYANRLSKSLLLKKCIYFHTHSSNVKRRLSAVMSWYVTRSI